MTQSRRYRIVTCDSGESQYRVDETSVSVPLVSYRCWKKIDTRRKSFVIEDFLVGNSFDQFKERTDIQHLGVDGALEFLEHNGKAGRWLTARRGEVISIPGNVKHALRNSSSENTSLLLVTTPNIYGFFRAIASPVNPDSKSRPLTPADMERLMALSAKHNYWLASPEENAAIGLEGF